MKFLIFLLIFCFVKDTPVLMASNPFRTNAAAYALAAMPVAVPIQDVRPDDMVKAYHHEDSYYAMADNKTKDDYLFVPGWQDYDYLDITPETWQIGTFEIIESNGDNVEVVANRPKKWYHENRINNIGDKTHFYMPENGINGEAILLSIRPTVVNTTNFLLNESGQVDRPVITTFKRNAPIVYDYHFSYIQPDGTIGNIVIGATPEHPFFSVERNAYIAVGELQLGEQVMTSGEKVVKFIAGKQRDKGESVYNFEVWREHNYYVSGKDGGEFLLVHNTYGVIEIIGSWINFKNRSGALVKFKKQSNWTVNNITAGRATASASKRLEFDVALKLKESGRRIDGIGLEGKIDGDIAGDIDVLTDKGMVEVKTSIGGVDIDQIKKYMDPTDPKFINTSKASDINARKVLVYVENATSAEMAAKKAQVLEALKDYKHIFDFDITNDLDDLANKMNN